MGIFDGCLLACDIDGTLLLNDYMPKRNIEKIKYFVSEGGVFALATGRTAGAVSAVTDKLDCIGPSIVANGSMIYDFKKDKALYDMSIPEGDRHIVKAVIDGCSTVGVEAHSGKKVLVLNNNQEAIDHEKYENLDAIPLDYENALGYNWNKVIYLFANEDEAKTVKQIISQFEHSSQFVDTSAVIYGRRRYYYEHVPCGVSKATTLKILCEKLNIKKGCCYAIGDYYNDLEMIKCADIGAALIDSPDEVKAVADVVVCDAQNGAVADFIDYLTERKINNGCKL
ncbi:MAG: HAD-IIB family hydrolase [Clostridia bacterium]|nr:HAD-IIB family hydrolase [Clostridia bacterium]